MAYLKFIFKFPSKKKVDGFLTFILCNFLLRTLQYFQKFLNLCFAHEDMKKTPSKVAHNRPKIIFFSTGPAAQMAQKQKSCTTKSPGLGFNLWLSLCSDWICKPERVRFSLSLSDLRSGQVKPQRLKKLKSGPELTFSIFFGNPTWVPKKYTVLAVKKIILSSFSHVVPQCVASPSSRAAWFSSAEVTRSRLLFLKADPIMLMSRPQTPLVARPKPAAQWSQKNFEVGFEIC